MPVIVRKKDYKLIKVSAGCEVAHLLNPEVIGNDQIILDYIKIASGSEYDIKLDSGAVGWIQLLAGTGILDGVSHPLNSNLILYLPRGLHTRYISEQSTSELLIAQIPNANRFDSEIENMPKQVCYTDWTREPILESEHDARKRIYLATPTLAGTNAFKGEMITYPPGTAAPEHHHVGAEHFQYVISGNLTASLNEERQELKAGDILYNYERELHTFINESNAEAKFVEFFVPGPCETVWSAGANVCAWLPTGIDSEGRKPARDIAYHVHGQDDGL